MLIIIISSTTHNMYARENSFNFPASVLVSDIFTPNEVSQFILYTSNLKFELIFSICFSLSLRLFVSVRLTADIFNTTQRQSFSVFEELSSG